jgi:hypothetical protein
MFIELSLASTLHQRALLGRRRAQQQTLLTPDALALSTRAALRARFHALRRILVALSICFVVVGSYCVRSMVARSMRTCFVCVIIAVPAMLVAALFPVDPGSPAGRKVQAPQPRWTGTGVLPSRLRLRGG